MPLDLIISKGLASAIVLLFFGAVIFFLRYLYGPNGRLRDPKWDAWNEDARREKENKDLSVYRTLFTDYAHSFFTGNQEDDATLQLKIDHSLCVLMIAEELAVKEAPFRDHQSERALRLAALFHDVGRFEQYTRWKTFADPLSCNHALLSVRIVKRRQFLQREKKDIRRMVLTAVALHNRHSIPNSVSGPTLDVLHALRDADKIDILRVLEEELNREGPKNPAILLHLKDEPESYSPAVLEALEQGRVAKYNDMRYTNDFRLMLCTWLNDFRFEYSLEKVRQQGLYDRILSGLAALPEVHEKAKNLVRQKLGGH